MTVTTLLPLQLLTAINSVLAQHKFSVLSVYAEAEKIRRRWHGHNIALEDIVNELVRRSEVHQVAVAFDPSEAAAALLGTNEASEYEDSVPELRPHFEAFTLNRNAGHFRRH